LCRAYLGGTLALYALLCQHIGIQPHGTLFEGEIRTLQRLSTLSRQPGRNRSPSASADPGGAGLLLRRLSDWLLCRWRTDRASGPSGSKMSGAAPAPSSVPHHMWWQSWSSRGETVRRRIRHSRPFQMALWGVAIAATGMVLGDGVLTPAISGEAACSSAFLFPPPPRSLARGGLG
jgi:hypothetical protein